MDAARHGTGLAKPRRGARKRASRRMRRATPPTERGRLPRPHPGRPRAEAWDRSAQARPQTPTARPVSAQPRPRFFEKSAPICHIFGPETHEYPPFCPLGATRRGRQKASQGSNGSSLRTARGKNNPRGSPMRKKKLNKPKPSHVAKTATEAENAPNGAKSAPRACHYFLEKAPAAAAPPPTHPGCERGEERRASRKPLAPQGPSAT